MPSWRRKQAPHEQTVIKNCRYCKGSGKGHYGNICQACKGSGKAKVIYGFPKGWITRKR